MVTFKDGPAAGVVLGLRRSPVMLRVTQNAKGDWDALDQPEDEPRRGERLHVYRLTGKPTWMHMRCSKRSASGYYAIAEYAALPDPPADEVLRDNALWREWLGTNKERLMPDWAKEKSE